MTLRCCVSRSKISPTRSLHQLIIGARCCVGAAARKARTKKRTTGCEEARQNRPEEFWLRNEEKAPWRPRTCGMVVSRERRRRVVRAMEGVRDVSFESSGTVIAEALRDERVGDSGERASSEDNAEESLHGHIG